MKVTFTEDYLGRLDKFFQARGIPVIGDVLSPYTALQLGNNQKSVRCIIETHQDGRFEGGASFFPKGIVLINGRYTDAHGKTTQYTAPS